MVWDYHDDNVADPGSEVEVRISGIPAKKATLRHYRIDADHINSYEAWIAMGSPQEPSPAQYKALEQAGKLAEFESVRDVKIRKGGYTVSFNLPRQGISLLLFEW